ncbi:MAG: hypothetical protein OSJ76_01895 [Alphaproteobacteria bacterium]|nr:hypothetical protein [Alphaproteobacteria bacterium]
MFKDEIVLPDGSVASSAADMDRYLKANDLVLSDNYSGEYRRNIRLRNEKAQKNDLWAEFLKNYKRMIWNGKFN